MADENKVEVVNPLELVVKESGIEPTEANTILTSFNNFFVEASKFEKRAKEIVVTDISQIADMAEARKIRLELKNIRVNAEKVKTNLKADIILKGKAIDGIYNVIKALVVPLEDHLEQQEKFADIWAEAQAEKKYSGRVEAMSAYVDDVTLYNLRDMSEEAFDKLLENSKIAFDQKQEAIRLAELKSIEDAKAKAIEDERIRKENETLKKEKEEREEKEKIENEKREKEEKARKDEDDRKEKEHQEKLKIEREKIEKLEREAKEKKEADEKAKRDEEIRLAKEKAEQEEKDRQAKLAPEKDKLFAYSESIKAIESPEGLSKAGLRYQL